MDATNIAENAGPAAAAATNPTLNLTPAASQAAPDLQVSQAASTPTASPELGASPKLVCELPLPVVEVPGASPAASQAANAKPLNMAAASVDANSSQQRQSTANVSASILGPALTRTGRDLLAQVEREAVITGRKQAGIDQTLADGRELLHQAGYPLDQPVDALFLHNLQRSAPQDGCEHGSKTASLDALGRAYVALTRTHFPVLLQSCTQAAKVTLAKLSAACGASIGKIRFWLADPYGGVTGMTPALALKIDNALAAQGKVVAAYAALAQDAAYEPAQSIMDQLLGRIPFGARLLAFRQQTHRPLKALLDQLQSEFGIKLVSGQLNGWEQGLYVPSEDMRGVISALDTLYQAHGELFAAWELEKPRQCQKPYALAFATWPSRLRAQVQSLVEYKTTNPQGLPEDPAADRWTSAATVAAFQDLCEQIFGFLVLEKGFAAEDLSLTLLCDWRLVRACFDWLRLRTRRVNFTTYEFWRSSTLLNLYRWYFPHQASDAAQDAHWQNRLATSAQVPLRIAPGVLRQQQIQLRTWPDQWCYHVAQTRDKARSFQKNNTFDRLPNIRRARPLLESNIGRFEIAAALSARVKQLLPRILCRKAAILCRRLTEAALLIIWNLRPSSLQRLKCDQVTVVDKLKIALDIPEAQFRNRGTAGSKGGLRGLLPDWECVHVLLRRYLEEARPILLGDPNLRGRQDAGYLFIDAFSRRRGLHQALLLAGGPIGEKVLYHDIVLTLGYNPWAERYLFAADAWRHNVPTDQIATATQTTAANAEKTFGKVRGPEKTQRANATVAKLLSAKKGRERKK